MHEILYLGIQRGATAEDTGRDLPLEGPIGSYLVKDSH